MKLVHKSLTPWFSAAYVILTVLSPLLSLSRVTAQEVTRPPEYLRFYDPADGFKPAQTNLTEIFLQIAGSLEESGSPGGYIRHMQDEFRRIRTAYEAKMEKPLEGHWPTYMTDEYLSRVISNWNILAPKLHLTELAKEAGRCTREGIRGTRDTGTIIVTILNEHQKTVVESMRTGETGFADFEHLRRRLVKDLEYNKAQVSMVGYEVARRDAVSYAIIFDGQLKRLFAKIDAAMPTEKAQSLKSAVSGVFLDLGNLAQSELELGIVDWALHQ